MCELSLYQPLGNHLAVARNGTTQSQVQLRTENPVTRIETIADGTINFGKVGYLAAPADSYELQPGDILYSHINSIKHVGKVAQYFGKEKTLYHGMNLLLLRLDGEVDKRYFFHYLNSYNARHYAQKECQKAINQVSLNTGQLKKLSVFTPPLPEQNLIARILDTLDTQIEQTEALIAKLEKVKEGLLHDLLTRGINENGQLRPSPEQAPELYKKSQLGLIPREWETVSLAEVTDLQVGYAFKSAWFKDSGIYRLLRGDNVGYGNPDWSSEKFLSKKLVEKFTEYLLNEGDIVIGMDRTFTKSGVKITEIGSEDTPSLLVQRVGRFAPKTGIEKSYMKTIAISPLFLKELSQQEKGMDIPHLSKSEILSPTIPLPSLKEQNRIGNSKSNFEKRIRNLALELSSLSSIKQGLMNDLLTGRVRVTPLLEQAQATTPA